MEQLDVKEICEHFGIPEVVINKKPYDAEKIPDMCERIREVLSRYQNNIIVDFNSARWVSTFLHQEGFDNLTHGLRDQAGDDFGSDAWMLLKDLARGTCKPLLDWKDLRAHAVLSVSCVFEGKERAPMQIGLIISPDYVEKFAEIIQSNP